MVEVFKTNVHDRDSAEEIIALLLVDLPGSQVSFDLEDCDRVLRIEYENVHAPSVIEVVSKKGFRCQMLT